MSGVRTYATADSFEQLPTQTSGVSVIIPTYNEVENVERVVDRCLLALSDYETEILVVDDDSPDRTGEVARELYSDDPRVRVVRRTDDHGLAQSVSEGFRRARYGYCAVIDADLQHPPEKLPALLGALDDGAQVAIGSRYVEGGGIENWSTYRKLVSWGATRLARRALRVTRAASDPMSGFFAVRREVVDGVELNPRGYKILLEVLSKGTYDYDCVTEVPYVFRERERGESNLTPAEYKTFLEHLVMLWLHSWGFDELVEPERAVCSLEFAFVGAVGTVVNTVVFALVGLGLGAHYLLAGLLAFLVAVNWNFVGNWALTFDQPSGDLLQQYAKFHAVSVGGLAFYTAFLVLFVDVLGVPALVSSVAAILGGFLFNFEGSERFVFGRF